MKKVETEGVTTYTFTHDIDKEPSAFVEFKKYKVFEEVIKYTQDILMTYAKEFLYGIGYRKDRSVVTKDYAYFEGDVPVLLIAHLDTVHHSPVSKIWQHKQKGYLIAREGIGGDDRCGVYAILFMANKGYRPYILFTTDEETGAKGARKAAVEIKPSENIRFMVELDRKGSEDSVYYDNDNKEFKKYIDSFGFKEAQGSFSDISVLGDAWNISSVNLSSGYYEAHSDDEKIYLGVLFATMKKVMAMMDAPPPARFLHVEKEKVVYDMSKFYGEDDDYSSYLGQGTSYQSSYKEEAAEDVFKGIALKHLRKAAESLDTIAKFPFVEKVYTHDASKDANGRTKEPFFKYKADGSMHWVSELKKRSGKFGSMLTIDEFNTSQRATSILTSVYMQYPKFDLAFDKFYADPAKWTEFITSGHKKKDEPKAKPARPEKGDVLFEKVSFDELYPEQQRDLIYEGLDCVEGIMSLPFVDDIDFGDKDITVKTKFAHGTLTMMAKNADFQRALKTIGEAEADIVLNSMIGLDQNIHMVEGLSKEIEANIGDGKERESKKSKATPPQSRFDRMSPNIQKLMVKNAVRVLDDLSDLKFVKHVELVKGGVFLSYEISGNATMNDSLTHALVDVQFLAKMETLYPSFSKELLNDLEGLNGALGTVVGFKDAVDAEQRKRLASPGAGGWNSLSRHDRNSMVNDGAGLMADLYHFKFVDHVTVYPKQNSMVVTYKAGQIIHTIDLDGILKGKDFVEQVVAADQTDSGRVASLIIKVAEHAKKYPKVFLEEVSELWDDFVSGKISKSVKEKEKDIESRAAELPRPPPPPADVKEAEAILEMSPREKEILKKVVEVSSPKDTKKFIEEWKKSGADFETAFEKFSGITFDEYKSAGGQKAPKLNAEGAQEKFVPQPFGTEPTDIGKLYKKVYKAVRDASDVIVEVQGDGSSLNVRYIDENGYDVFDSLENALVTKEFQKSLISSTGPEFEGIIKGLKAGADACLFYGDIFVTGFMGYLTGMIGKKSKGESKAEKKFDDAPAYNETSSREIDDRYGDDESEEEADVFDDGVMSVEEAVDILTEHFDTYGFTFDWDDMSSSLFTDDEGVERPISGLRAEIGSEASAASRKQLLAALETLMEAGDY